MQFTKKLFIIYIIYVIYNFDKNNISKFYLLDIMCQKKHSKCVELFKFILSNNLIFNIMRLVMLLLTILK